MTSDKTIDEELADAFRRADALPASLDERLKLYLSDSRAILPDLEASYDRLVQRVAANLPDVAGPKVGEALPEFCLTDSHGTLVSLSTLLSRGPLVVSFNRGPWCDYCGLELHALSRAYPAIIDAGGEVVSIVPETSHYAQGLQASRGVPFRVLTDLDLGYALGLGLVFWVGEKIMTAYREFGIDLARFQGNNGWLLPIPATIVVGKDGIVRARFVDADFRHRMNMEDILHAVRAS